MLPRVLRVTSSAEHRTVGRRGARAGTPLVVVHLLRGAGDSGTSARAGLAVGRSVGNSVVRHRVSRRLRHLLAPRLGRLPAGSSLVVRANPPSSTATSEALAADLDRALARALSPRSRARREVAR